MNREGRALRRRLITFALTTAALLSPGTGCHAHDDPGAATKGNSQMTVHYLEIVSDDAEALTGLYQDMFGLTFGAPDPDLGMARVATRADGTLIGIRKPLAAHEQPIVRTYLAVTNIEDVVKKAAAHGATIAYPPTQQGQRGTFAIVIQGGTQHGLWQR